MSDTINLRVKSVTGQHELLVTDLPTNSPWEAALAEIVSRLDLPASLSGHDDVWQGVLARKRQQIHGKDRVGEVLQDNDLIILTPDIIAGIGQPAVAPGRR